MIPAAVLAEQLMSRRRLYPKYALFMLWGYLQYRLSGQYRIKRAGGPPGMSQGFPEKIITDGIYAWTRNPMYMGHLIFLGGLALATRSPLAFSILSSVVPWYSSRAQKDEERLAEKFGQSYEDYKEGVPRWLGSPEQLIQTLKEVQARQ